MKTGARVPALLLLAALVPACGGGGGGGAVGTGAYFPPLPTLVAPVPLAGTGGGLPLDASAATTTINVTGMMDDAVQTAIQNAINLGGGPTPSNKVVLTTGGPSRTVVLTSALHLNSNQGSQRTLILDGSNQVTLSGGLTTRILEIDDQAQITIQRMRFVDARTPQNGGAVNSLSRVRLATFINCTFENCQATEGGPDRGGGAIRIWNGEHTQISGCTFTLCAASNGGAVNSLGTRLTIINSTFNQNAAIGTGGGGEIGQRGGIGGAVYVDNVSNHGTALPRLEIQGCVFNANIANDHAGAVFGYTNKAELSTTIINQCTFAGNRVPTGHGNAGALYSQDGTLTLTNSTFHLNVGAGSGGGIFRPSDDTMTSTTTVTNCTFHRNTGADGAGLWIAASSVTLLNVTVTENEATNYVGGIFLGGPSVTVQNSVFEGNTATAPASSGQTSAAFSGTGNIQAPATGPTASRSITTGLGTTKVASAMLGPLQDNTGPAFTRQPSAGSPALSAATGAPATDQRGVTRGSPADSGACEGP